MLETLFKKINNKHFFSFLGNIMMSVLSMIIVAILFRSMAKVDIGYWFFFQTLFVLLDTFRTGFLQIALITFYTGAEEKRAKEVIGSIWFLAICITAILVLANLAILPFLKYFTSTAIIATIQWFGLTFLATLPSNIASWILQADQRFDRLLILRVLTQGSFIICLLLLIFFKQVDLDHLLLVNFLINIMVSCIAIIFKWTHISTFFKRSKKCILEIFHFGKFSVGTTISANLLRSSDTFIITFLLGPAALAIYNIPLRLMELIEIPIRSSVSTAMSSMAKAVNRNNLKEVVYILQKYAGTLFFIFIPIAIGGILFADIAVSLLGGGKYVNTEAANLYRIMMVMAVFYPIDRFIGVSLDIIHQPKINFIKVILMLVLNVSGDFIGIFTFGNLYGVALSTLFPLVIGMFFGYYNLNKFIPFKFSNIFVFGHIQIRIYYRRLIKTKLNF